MLNADGWLIEKPLGICPSCGQAVFASQETDGPVWTCPLDLNPANVFYQADPDPIPEAAKQQAGIFANCHEDFGEHCPFPRIPLHSYCYDHRTW